nr:DUF3883 domain-containing protein [Corynebacterium variabile]
MPRIGAITCPTGDDYKEDIAFALETATWGSRTLLKDEDTHPHAWDIILISTGYSHPAGHHKNRQKLEPFRQGTLDQIYIVLATDSVRDAVSPHWKKEVLKGSIIYKHIFPFRILSTIHRIPVLSLPEPVQNLVQKSATGGAKPRCANVSDQVAEELTQLTEFTSFDDLLQGGSSFPVDVASTFGKAIRTSVGSSASAGQGWSSNSKRNTAVEQRAVTLAWEYYKSLGWDIEEKGKPYDLKLTKSGNEERHVEVKGMSSHGGEVHLTGNEVIHAFAHPTDLFLVDDIIVTPKKAESGNFDTSDIDYDATGGTPSIIPDWRPEEERLTRVKLRYNVPWENAISVNLPDSQP